MYKAITWFTIGYMFHKHGVPVLLEVAKKPISKSNFWD